MVRALSLIGLGPWLHGCAAPEPPPGRDAPSDTAVHSFPALADEVRWAPGAGDLPFQDPALAVNGVRGAGLAAGSTDVYSLASEGDEAGLVLAWTEGRLVDGPGIDLVAYENPFAHPGGVFIDPVLVELSADGTTWVPFPHDYTAEDEVEWSADPAHWVGFAGLTPVLHHAEDNPTDPLDPAVSGGDGFDLADLGDDPAAAAIRERGACCVRLWSASARVNPDTGQPYPRDPIANGADIDGVYGRL